MRCALKFFSVNNAVLYIELILFHFYRNTDECWLSFANHLLFFCLKSQKNAVFSLHCEISIAEIRLRLNLVRKCRSAITELRCASIKSKSSLRKLRCASEIKKNYVANFALRFHRLKKSLRLVELRFWYNDICSGGFRWGGWEDASPPHQPTHNVQMHNAYKI